MNITLHVNKFKLKCFQKVTDIISCIKYFNICHNVTSFKLGNNLKSFFQHEALEMANEISSMEISFLALHFKFKYNFIILGVG